MKQNQQSQVDENQILASESSVSLNSREQDLVMHELIYCEDQSDHNRLISLIKNEWPTAQFQDGSDFIHEHRLAVTVNGLNSERFFRFAIQHGFALCCLSFHIEMYEHPERVNRLLDEAIQKRQAAASSEASATTLQDQS